MGPAIRSALWTVSDRVKTTHSEMAFDGCPLGSSGVMRPERLTHKSLLRS